MTNREISDKARRIVFTQAWPDVYPDVARGLKLIVDRQVRRYADKRLNSMHKDVLHARTGVSTYGAKAPGHDAAVKAAKDRKHDNYCMLEATSVPAYEQDRRRG